MIGKKLTKLRNEHGLTQQAVAEGIGVSRATYAHYEIDRREPDNETLCKLAAFFHVSADYLLNLTELPQPYALSNNSPLHGLVLEDVREAVSTPADLQQVNPALAAIMQQNNIVTLKAKLDLIEKSGLSLEVLVKLITLAEQLKSDNTEK